MEKKITVYFTDTCHFCHQLMDFLKENNIEFESKNVGTDTEARKEMMDASGQMGVPVSVIGDDVVVGFNEPVIRELLGVSE